MKENHYVSEGTLAKVMLGNILRWLNDGCTISKSEGKEVKFENGILSGVTVVGKLSVGEKSATSFGNLTM
jgi:hypothetical protein